MFAEDNTVQPDADNGKPEEFNNHDENEKGGEKYHEWCVLIIFTNF